MTAEGRPFWQKIAVMALNLSTVWECRRCRGKYPHWPLSGERVAHSAGKVCTFCSDRQ